MLRGELTELHFITPISNLGSIMEHGILSNERSKKLHHKSVAMQEIQARRASKVVPGGRPLHEYANLYICARNPMMYLRRSQHDELTVLRISTDVLDLKGVVVSDSNSSSDYVRFAAAPKGLDIVRKDMTFADDWRDPDQIQMWKKKAAKCAEVLVPDQVDIRYIIGAYVCSERVKTQLEAARSGLTVTVNPYLFFM
jgi:hypothetical protein